MPSTHLSLHYHLVFSTKERVPSIIDDVRDRVHAYLGGIVRGLGGVPLEVGGVADHVHLLIGLKATHTLADVLRTIKGDSSRWIHSDLRLPHFAWQEGYGGFTVSRSHLDSVREYIRGQEEHHRRHIGGIHFRMNTGRSSKSMRSNSIPDTCGECFVVNALPPLTGRLARTPIDSGGGARSSLATG